jgi:cytochrome oxidase Cu insertion factor (SCO1/SenC/PrrC family)
MNAVPPRNRVLELNLEVYRMNKIRLLWFSVLIVSVFLLAACGGSLQELLVGDTAPEFSLPAADGTKVSLSDYKGQPVLLYFHMAVG